jgi:hypothetical protein
MCRLSRNPGVLTSRTPQGHVGLFRGYFTLPSHFRNFSNFMERRFFTAFTKTRHLPLLTRLNPYRVSSFHLHQGLPICNLPTSRTTEVSWFDSDTYNRFICSANYSHWCWGPTGVLFSGYRRLFPREQNSQFVKLAAHSLVPSLIGGAIPPQPHTFSWYSLV